MSNARRRAELCGPRLGTFLKLFELETERERERREDDAGGVETTESGE